MPHLLPSLTGLLASALITASANGEPAAPKQTISHFSGEPVPRFAPLRYAAVNGRAGPGESHPIIWRYEREGLPMLVIKESRDWRRVRDPDGDEVWVHARMLGTGQTAMVRAQEVLHRQAGESAAPVAELGAGLVVDLERCAEGWCEVSADGRSGWLPIAALWGVDLTETGV